MGQEQVGGQEKRRHKRAEASFSLTFTVLEPMDLRLKMGTGPQDAMADDLSEGGLAILSNYPVPAGAVLELRFKLLNTNGVIEEHRTRNFKLRAEARYMVPQPDRSYRVGLRFSDIQTDDRFFIKQCV